MEGFLIFPVIERGHFHSLPGGGHKEVEWAVGLGHHVSYQAVDGSSCSVSPYQPPGGVIELRLAGVAAHPVGQAPGGL